MGLELVEFFMDIEDELESLLMKMLFPILVP